MRTIGCSLTSCLLCLWTLSPLATSLVAAHPHDEDEGLLSSVKPRIPEPMIFDLVRPLGAQKGEFEVNSLFVLPAAGPHRKLEWAPEVEYALADGYGVEWELPMDNGSLQSYKLALQGTMGVTRVGGRKRMIHGWQAIGYYNRMEPGWQADFLYIHGIRFTRRFSYLGLYGGGMRDSSPQLGAVLANNSIFFTPRPDAVYGVEANLERGIGNRDKGTRVLLMPQRHFRFAHRYHLQLGAGWSRSAEGRNAFAAGWRFIREF